MAITIDGTNGLTTDNAALKLDGTTLVIDDTNNRVGIGTASPTNKLDIYDTSNPGDPGSTVIIYGERAGSANLLALRAASLGGTAMTVGNGSVLRFQGYDGVSAFKNLTAIQTLAAADVSPTASSGHLVFYTTPSSSTSLTERARFTSDGYLRMASGTGGIQFNGDTAAANALDDYEEGTFTPSYEGTTTAGTTTYTGVRNGYYTKIGNIVTVIINLGWTNATGTGVSQIGGLPFQSTNETHNYAAVSIRNDGLAQSSGQIQGYVQLNDTKIRLGYSNLTTGIDTSSPIDTVVSRIMIQATYRTT